MDAESIATRMKAMGHLSSIADLDVDNIEYVSPLVFHTHFFLFAYLSPLLSPQNMGVSVEYKGFMCFYIPKE